MIDKINLKRMFSNGTLRIILPVTGGMDSRLIADKLIEDYIEKEPGVIFEFLLLYNERYDTDKDKSRSIAILHMDELEKRLKTYKNVLTVKKHTCMVDIRAFIDNSMPTAVYLSRMLSTTVSMATSCYIPIGFVDKAFAKREALLGIERLALANNNLVEYPLADASSIAIRHYSRTKMKEEGRKYYSCGVNGDVNQDTGIEEIDSGTICNKCLQISAIDLLLDKLGEDIEFDLPLNFHYLDKLINLYKLLVKIEKI